MRIYFTLLLCIAWGLLMGMLPVPLWFGILFSFAGAFAITIILDPFDRHHSK